MWAAALAFCRSETSELSCPSVEAVVAEATRSRCSSMDSCPSLSASSSSLQVSLRSLSLARVPVAMRGIVERS
ncbi:Uncharacterised protein [Mycobacteroides abscessus subsp. massiliense]|nr:Uncharacterised protein [Mycobacteroides abscessus subsp. massiliense]